MKYFVASDIHSFFSIFKQALDEAGFDKKNDEHILIILGDLLDRGDETLETIKFIKSIPKKRRILIRGNHEYLFRDMVRRGKYLRHDNSNGTIKSLLNLNKEESMFTFDYCINTKVTKDYIKWIESDDWVNWYELDLPEEKFTFVHAFIPLSNKANLPAYYAEPHNLEYNKDWRTTSTQKEIEDSTWGCPWKLFDAGLFPEDRTLVCGHWHVGADDVSRSFWAHYSAMNLISEKKLTEEEIENNWSILSRSASRNYIFRGEKIIALDACTAYSGKVNVMVIDEQGKTYQFGKELSKFIIKGKNTNEE